MAGGVVVVPAWQALPQPRVTRGIQHCRMAAAFAAYVLLASWLQLCSAQTAYIVPSMQADSPSNHSYLRLGSIVGNKAMLAEYDEVVLTTDYRIVPSLFGGDYEPVSLVRNLTITSSNYSTEGYKLLELEFAIQRVVIPQGITLTLKNLGLGRARRTSGQGIPFFAGEGEQSLLVLDNVVRIRTACAHNEPELLAALTSIARRDPPSVPGQPHQQQVQLLPSFQFRGETYPDAIWGLDVRYFVGPVDVPDTTYYAGYSMWQRNTTRICETYVSDECVAKRGAEACVEDQIVRLTAMTASNRLAAQQPPGVNLATIIAPSVVGGVLLAVIAAGLALLLRRRQRQARASSNDSLLPVSDKGSGLTTGGSGFTGPPYNGADEPLSRATPGNLPGPFSGADGSIEHLAIGNRAGSWSLGAFHTAPEFDDATPNDKLKLGVLLGAGSFGRVYKGTWRGLDVAVKVLQHDCSTAASISNEVDLVMSFHHENIVRAYYFITWTRSTPQQDTRAEDQSSNNVSTATTALSTARSPQPTLSPVILPKGPQLAPVVEVPSGGTKSSSASQSSAAASDAASVASLAAGLLGSGSNLFLSAGSAGHSTTVRVSIGSLDQLGDQGVKVLTSRPTSSRGVSVNLGSSNSSANNSAHTSSAGGAVSGHNSGSNAAGASVAAPAGLNIAALRTSFESSVALARVQQQQQGQAQDLVQQMPSFVPMVRAPSSGSTESASSAGRMLWASSGRAAAATVQLVPLTDALLRACSPQQEYAGGDNLSANYAVSGAHTSGRSAGGLRNAAAPSSLSTGGTSSSLLPMVFSSQQLQQDLPQQPAAAAATADNVNLQDQLGLQDSPHPQAQHHTPLLPASSPSPTGLAKTTATASFSVSQSQPVWLQNTASSSGGGSGNKSAFKGRSTDEAQTWLIFEYCDGSTLLDLLAPDGALGPHLTGHSRMGPVLTLLLDVAAGMSYLHSRNVLHGDLKPGNVLIKHVHGAPYGRMAKVSDFGLSRALQAGQSHRSTRTFGTLNHTAPELLRLGRLSPAGDVYAFGMIMWEAFTGQVAFQGLHYGEVFEQVALLQCRPDIPPDMPADYAELVTQCWAADPLTRPSFTTVMQRLDVMLAALMQDEIEAHERYVSDL